MSRLALSQWRLALAIPPCLFTASNATTLLDPHPEPATTRFGQTIVTMGDVNADGVPDLAGRAHGEFVGFGLTRTAVVVLNSVFRVTTRYNQVQRRNTHEILRFTHNKCRDQDI